MKSQNKSQLWAVFTTFIAILIIFSTITFIFRKSLTDPGRPPGIDTRSFTHTAKVIADYFNSHSKIPAIDPYWYNDFEINYVPPLIYPPIILVYWLTGNSDYAGSVIYYLIALMTAFGMFYLLKKESGTFNAIIGSFMWALSPLIFIESRSRILAVAFLPLAFYFVNQILEKKKSQKL